MADEITKSFDQIEKSLNLLLKTIPDVFKARKPKGPKKPPKPELIPKKVWVRDPTKTGGGYYAFRWVHPETGEVVIPDKTEFELHPDLVAELKQIAEEVKPEDEVKKLDPVVKEEIKETKERVENLPLLDREALLDRVIFTLEPPKRKKIKPSTILDTTEPTPPSEEPEIVVDPITGKERPEIVNPSEIVKLLNEGKMKYQNLTPKEKNRFIQSSAVKRQVNYAMWRSWPKELSAYYQPSKVKRSYYEDLKQELFMKVHELMQNYDPEKGASVETYLGRNLVGYGTEALKKWLQEVPKLTYKYIEHTPTEVEEALEMYRIEPEVLKRMHPLVVPMVEEFESLSKKIQDRMWSVAKKDPWMQMAMAAQFEAMVEELQRRGEAAEVGIPRGLKVYAEKLWQDLEADPERKRRFEAIGVDSVQKLHKYLQVAWQNLVDELKADKELQKWVKERDNLLLAIRQELMRKAKLMQYYNLLKGYVLVSNEKKSKVN